MSVVWLYQIGKPVAKSMPGPRGFFLTPLFTTPGAPVLVANAAVPAAPETAHAVLPMKTWPNLLDHRLIFLLPEPHGTGVDWEKPTVRDLAGVATATLIPIAWTVAHAGKRLLARYSEEHVLEVARRLFPEATPRIVRYPRPKAGIDAGRPRNIS